MLINGKLSPAALRGQKLFKTAKCASCHSGELFTDKKKHLTGTAVGVEAEKLMEFDTPTLVEVWRTAPYLSRGQAATVLDVLSKKNNPNNQHGKTSDLTKKQLADLAEYVMSL
jgi:cytochrome c peroxidase